MYFLLHRSVPGVLWASSSLRAGSLFLCFVAASISNPSLLRMFFTSSLSPVSAGETASLLLLKPFHQCELLSLCACFWFSLSSRHLGEGKLDLIFRRLQSGITPLEACERDRQWVLLKISCFPFYLPKERTVCNYLNITTVVNCCLLPQLLIFWLLNT